MISVTFIVYMWSYLLDCLQVEAHAAVSAAEAERSTRAEAEGLSETLRQVSANGVCEGGGV